MRTWNGLGVTADDTGELLHEGEFTFTRISGNDVVRKPGGVHLDANGECQCSFDCCMTGDDMPYACVCPDCTGVHAPAELRSMTCDLAPSAPTPGDTQ